MMKQVIGMGDLLLSLSPPGYLRFGQATTFDAFYTGAEANVCAALAQFGIPTELLTSVPENDIGKTAVSMLRKFGVGTKHIVYQGDRIGVLYLEKGASQRPSKVIYDRKHSAICQTRPEDFDFDTIFANADWFHITGITPALSDMAPALCLAACQKAKAHNLTVSCDLNYRKKLWTTQQAKATMECLLPYVDVLVANEEDVEKVLGIRAGETDVTKGQIDQQGYVDVAHQLIARYGLRLVATTLRKSYSASENGWSAVVCSREETAFSREYQIHIVNRVGGGDALSAGLIYGLKMGYTMQETVEFAAAASCLKHSIEFDFNLVSLEEVRALMEGDGSGRVQR